jgi:hypothetical protein
MTSNERGLATFWLALACSTADTVASLMEFDERRDRRGSSCQLSSSSCVVGFWNRVSVPLQTSPPGSALRSVHDLVVMEEHNRPIKVVGGGMSWSSRSTVAGELVTLGPASADLCLATVPKLHRSLFCCLSFVSGVSDVYPQSILSKLILIHAGPTIHNMSIQRC